MSRYALILDELKPEPKPVSSPQKDKKETNSLMMASKRLKKGKVKGIESVWIIRDKITLVALERSSRNSTCAVCRKRIPRGTPRYRCITPGYHMKETNYYHRKCCPSHIRKFIREYNKRDLDFEEMEDCYASVINYMDMMFSNKYAKEFFTNISENAENYLNEITTE